RLTAVPLSASSIRIDWARVDRAASYELTRSIGGSPLAPVGTFVPGRVSFYDDGLATGVTHRYVLNVFDSDGRLLATAEATTEPKACTIAQAIDSPTVWTREASPYCIPTGQPSANSFPVRDGLVIEPGVVVLIAPDTGMNLNAPIAAIGAVGTAEEPIVFTVDQPDPSLARWGVIDLQNGVPTTFNETLTALEYAEGSRFQHVIFEYGSTFQSRFSIDLDACVFRHQRGTSNGATIFFPGINGRVSIQNSLFIQNSCMSCDGGGAAFTLDDARLQLQRNAWFFNSALDGGGAWSAEYFNSPSITASNSLFFGNRSDGNGGAIRLVRASALGVVSATISHSRFDSNTADQNGGALYSDVDISVESSVFENNVATLSGGAGYQERTPGTYRDCSFSSNQSTTGGALVSNDVVIVVERSRFEGNEALAEGGGFAGRGQIRASTFDGNTAPLAGGLALDAGTSELSGCLVGNNAGGGLLIRTTSAALSAPALDRNTILGNDSFNIRNAECTLPVVFTDAFVGNPVSGIEDTCLPNPTMFEVRDPVTTPWPLCTESIDPTCVGAP
ncbi:MAG: hypothetical protein AAF658_08325, partial [Myxococcota bacterium]